MGSRCSDRLAGDFDGGLAACRSFAPDLVNVRSDPRQPFANPARHVEQRLKVAIGRMFGDAKMTTALLDRFKAKFKLTQTLDHLMGTGQCQ